MKKPALILMFGLLLLLPASQMQAQTLIAVHNETDTSVYSNLDTAIVKAKAGDYIYLPGGSFTISVPINKQLQIIGVAHNPDSCAVTGITTVTGSVFIMKGSDHGSLTGLNISGGISFSSDINGNGSKDVNISYFSIERCKILYTVNIGVHATNILINECILDLSSGYLGGGFSEGLVLSKCIIKGNDIRNFDS